MQLRHIRHYSCYYCSVCRAISRTYGRRYAVFNSYEAVLLSILASEKGRPPQYAELNRPIEKKRCTVFPPIKVDMMPDGTPAADDAADISLLSFYIYLQDKIRDSNFSGRAAARFVLLTSAPAFKKMKHALSSKWDIQISEITALLSEQSAMEKEMPAFPEAYYAVFGRLTGYIFKKVLCTPSAERIGYQLGTVMHMYDALADYHRDKAAGCFNPLLVYEPQLNLHNAEEVYDRLSQIIENKARMMLDLCVDFGYVRHLLENIFLKGIPESLESLRSGFISGKSRKRTLRCDEI